MKFLVTGVNGQLGYDIMYELLSRGYDPIGSDIVDVSSFTNYVKLDITNESDVNRVISNIKPDIVFHCAAWTAVDKAEEEENKVMVDSINHLGTKYIANICKAINAKMVYISTDYVFSGEGTTPWKADDKSYAPLNVYGKSKLDGELEVSSILDKYFIVRIAWVFGKNGNNFIKTMLNLADKGYKELKVVSDQYGNPTYTLDLARLLVDISLSDKYGYYHATNEGEYISWCDFAKYIFKAANKDVKVIPVTTIEYGLSKAKRPYNSRLDKSKLVENGFIPLPSWQDATNRYIKELIGDK